MTMIPAFPVPGLQDDEAFNGMSLRDFFAAHAIAMVARQADLDNAGTPELAAACYEFADQLLEERTAPLAVRADQERRANQAWDRAGLFERLLRAVISAADKGDVGQTDALRTAIQEAELALDETDIPF